MVDEKLHHITPEIDVGFKSISVEHMEPLEHYHDACEIALFVKADINVFLKDRPYAIRDGDLLFIDAYEIHKIIYTENKDYSRYVLNFNKSCLQDILAQLGVDDILQSISQTGTRRIRLNLKQSCASIQGNDRSDCDWLSPAETGDRGAEQAQTVSAKHNRHLL
jgi:hypothetical protein